MILEKKVIYQTGAIREFEKPEVCKAIKVANANKWVVGLSPTEWDERKARLKKEHEENTKAPGSGGEQPNEGNPALAESASQFNDSLLNEQGKKIAELTMENERLKDQVAVLYAYKEHNENFDRKQIKRLGKEITRLNKIIHKKNLKIDEMRKESSRHLEGKMKMFGENFDLEQELKDKNAVLSDVAEELRLLKIREKNLTEVCQKYMNENEELKKKLANKIVDKIDAQALKSAESALAYKEKVIDKLAKENNDYKKCVEEFRNKIADMTIGKIDIQNIRLKEKNKEIKELNDKLKSINKNRHNELAEKDEVIAELDKELDEANKHKQQAYRSCADKNKEIRALKLQISALEKRGNGIDWKRNADAIKLYVNRASHEGLWSPISQDICNEQELSFTINHGGKRVKYALRFDGTDIVYECSDPDKKPSFFRDDSVGAVTNQKDCSPVKDTHPTEDNHEEIEIEKVVKLVRKAMKEGRTVTIDYKD